MDGKRPSSRAPKADWLERLDVVAKLALGVAGILLSATIGFATIRFNQQAAQRQIQQQSDELALQRRTTAVQLLASQLPSVLRGSDKERLLTLRLVETVDPGLVRQIGEALLSQAENPAAAARAQEIIAHSTATAQEVAFAEHRENARKYRDFGLDASAAREYLQAYDALAPSARSQVSPAVLEARRAYEAGNYPGAARILEKALQAIHPPFADNPKGAPR
jgi:tetratricopeptide (TPR) repeat protein